MTRIDVPSPTAQLNLLDAWYREQFDRSVLANLERGIQLLQSAANACEKVTSIEALTRTMNLCDNVTRTIATLRLRCERRIGELLREGRPTNERTRR